MQVPVINFRAPVESNVEGIEATTKAARGAADLVTEGLRFYGQEMIKADLNKADLHVATQTKAVVDQLQEQPTLDKARAQSMLGSDYSALPAEVRKMFDENAEVPSWKVAGSIFDARVGRATAEAEKGVVSSWRGELRDTIAKSTLERKAALNAHQTKLMHASLTVEEKNTIQGFLDSGFYAEAGKVAENSKVMLPGEKEAWHSLIYQRSQTDPVEQHLQVNDVQALTDDLVRLGSDKYFTSLGPKEREVYTERIKTRLNHLSEAAKKQADTKDDQEESYWYRQAVALRRGRAAAGQPVTVADAARFTAMLEKSTLPGKTVRTISDHVFGLAKEGKTETSTDPYVYRVISASVASNPEEWKKGYVVLPNGQKTPLETFIPSLSISHWTHFSDLQAAAKSGKDDITDGALSTSNLIDIHLRSRGLNLPSERDEKKIRMAGELEMRAVAAVAAKQAENPTRKLSYDERASAVANAFSENVTVNSRGRATKGGMRLPGADANILGAIDTNYPLVPQPVRDQMYAETAPVVPIVEKTWARRYAGQKLTAADIVAIAALSRDPDFRKNAGIPTTGNAAGDAELYAAAAVEEYRRKKAWLGPPFK